MSQGDERSGCVGASSFASRSPWPQGKRAAVSLTYDDGMTSHYQVAAPQLARFNFKATFFLNEVSHDAPWRRLLEDGHELAAHTQNHPCPREFDLPSRPSEEFDLPSLQSELERDVAQLQRLGQSPPFTFAYPCGSTVVGHSQSYVPLVRERFVAARMAQLADGSAEADLHYVPAQFGLQSADELLAAVDRNSQEEGWLVLGFHGVGQGWLVTDSDVHQEFLQGLSERGHIWVATFRDVAVHLRASISGQ